MKKTKSNIIGYFIFITIILIIIVGSIKIFSITNNYDKTYLYENFHNRYSISLGCGHRKKENMAAVRVGNEHFKVHEDMHNHEEAAKLMSNLDTIAKKLIVHLNEKYKNNNIYANTLNEKYKNRVLTGIEDLTQNYKTPNLEENIPSRSGGDTSFVINKGDVFAMCLRDPEQNHDLEDNHNDLIFVLIHEMAHLFTKSYGHDFMFWSNFKFLLEEATLINIYHPINYKLQNAPYCGINITYSPLFDKDLPNYIKNDEI